MRRRMVEQSGAAPSRLLRYDPADWGGGPDAPQRWYDALDEWREAGNEPVDHPPGTFFPDVPFDASTI